MRLLMLALIFPLVGIAQKNLRIEDFTTQNKFYLKSVYGINWMKDGSYYSTLENNKVVRYAVQTGTAEEVIFDGNTSNLNLDEYSLSEDESKLLLMTNRRGIYRHSYIANYYVYDRNTKALFPLSEGTQQYATFSPDGKHVAFTRDNNLFIVRLADKKEWAVTTDGAKNSIINGSCDWVYEEEFGFPNAFYWSPDGRYVAYYRFDESKVKEYLLQYWNHGQLYPSEYRFKYPKAGEQNSSVEIWVYDVAKNSRTKADVNYTDNMYIPHVQWTKDAETLAVRTLNRLQNNMRHYHVQASTGRATNVVEEKSTTYLDIEYVSEIFYLSDKKRMILSSEQSGWKHFYLYDVSGKLLNPITKGSDWEATDLVYVDEKKKLLYYLSTEENYLNRQLWSVTLDGKTKKKISTEAGEHRLDISPDGAYYLDYVSASDKPLAVYLMQTEGHKKIKTLEDNQALKKTYDDYQLTNKEFFQYTSADGVTKLDGYWIKPKNFDPSKKYPVMVFQYSGPRHSMVLNSYGYGRSFFWFQYLAQQGVLTAVVDTRGTGSRGEAFTKCTYLNLGKLETEDILSAGRFLKTLPYVDANNLSLHGWSYGGFMTAMVMTHGDVYQKGIAGAPVTDYRFYDTIYTERFMQTPQLNPTGYENNPVTYAKNLSGKFLLIHGTGDDNVHVQNSIALQDALIQAGKPFQSFFYPDQAHGFAGGKVNHYLYTQMSSFILSK